MADAVYINAEEGMARVMKNAKLYTRLLTKFKTDTNLDGITAAVDSGDWEKAQAAAHTIKGVAANLSLTELWKQSLECETQIKGKSLNPESLESLKACFAKTIEEVEKVIAENA
jgi:HPt (histidine-containing phosphotransfer) domain-containing protein